MLRSADPKTLSKPLLDKMLSKARSSTSCRISSSFSIESRTRVNDERSPLPAFRDTIRALISDLLIVIWETSIEGEKALATLMVLAMTSSVVLKVTAPCLRRPWSIMQARSSEAAKASEPCQLTRNSTRACSALASLVGLVDWGARL